MLKADLAEFIHIAFTQVKAGIDDFNRDTKIGLMCLYPKEISFELLVDTTGAVNDCAKSKVSFSVDWDRYLL